MPTIICTRRGKDSATDYDIEDRKRRQNLERNIKLIGEQYLAAKRSTDIQYQKARLQYVAITCKKALRNATSPSRALIEEIQALLSEYIDIQDLPEVAHGNPEKLFNTTSAKSYRKTVAYQENITPALAADSNLTSSLVDNPPVDNAALLQVINQCQADIEEHAMRRVMLFFLLCVGVYKRQCDIALEATTKQHGKGAPGSGFVGAHSSLFTNVEAVFEGTYFAELMNATVELPSCVNDFDRLIEGQNGEHSHGGRRRLLPILEKVSKGEETPITAMSFFFKEMQGIFNEIMDNMGHNTRSSSVNVRARILALQQKGTFDYADSSKQAISATSVACWLRVSRSAAAFFLSRPEMAEPCYQKRQHEILNS